MLETFFTYCPRTTEHFLNNFLSYDGYEWFRVLHVLRCDFLYFALFLASFAPFRPFFPLLHRLFTQCRNHLFIVRHGLSQFNWFLLFLSRLRRLLLFLLTARPDDVLTLRFLHHLFHLHLLFLVLLLVQFLPQRGHFQQFLTASHCRRSRRRTAHVERGIELRDHGGLHCVAVWLLEARVHSALFHVLDLYFQHFRLVEILVLNCYSLSLLQLRYVS